VARREQDHQPLDSPIDALLEMPGDRVDMPVVDVQCTTVDGVMDLLGEDGEMVSKRRGEEPGLLVIS
jgi:hypothetical protein